MTLGQLGNGSPLDPHEETRKMVADLVELDDGLSDWEVDFVENMSRKEVFSDKQTDIIEKLWQKHF